MSAAYGGRAEIVRDLLDAGANINIRDNDGWTALMFAAMHGHTDVVRTLVARDGINIDHASESGWMALMLAAHYGHQEIEVLIENHTKKKIPLDGDSATKIPKHRKDDHNDDDSPGKPGDKAMIKKISGSLRKLSVNSSTNTSTKKARGNPKKEDTRSERVMDDRDFHSSYEHFTNKLAPYFSTAALGVMVGFPRRQIGK